MNPLRPLGLALGLAALPLAAQDSPELATMLRLERGWTSNVEGAQGGQPDQYVVLRHGLESAHAGQDFALRGGFTVTQQRYLRLDAENDTDIEAVLSGHLALSPGTQLRGSLGFGFAEEGQSLGGGVSSLTSTLRGAMEVEIVHRVGAFEMAVGGGYSRLQPGESRFLGFGLAPTRLTAEAAMASAHMRLGYHRDTHTALQVTALWRQSLVPEADRVLYGRLQAGLARLSLGLKHATPLRAAFTLEAGIDTLSTPGHAAVILPYGTASLELAVAPGLFLAAGFSTDTLMADPADGLADWQIEGQAGLELQPGGPFGLGLTLFARHKRSVGFDIALADEQGARLRATLGLGEALALGAMIERKQVTGMDPAFAETRIGMWLEAQL